MSEHLWNSHARMLVDASFDRHAQANPATDASAGFDGDAWQSLSRMVSEAYGLTIDRDATAPTIDYDRLRTAADAFVGTQLGRYEIRELVGYGGFGIVFRAWDGQLKRDVALKIPHPERLADPGVRDRFLSEARVAAILRHPGIVQVFEVGEAGPVVFIASEFCQGPNLAQWLPRQPRMSVEQVVGLVAEIADAVGFAHQCQIVHQDLKPGNIIMDQRPGNVGDNCVPRLTDFGLSFHTDVAEDGLRRQLGGTPEYMAPEQRGHRGDRVGKPSDVYALGILLQRILNRPAHPKQSKFDDKSNRMTRDIAAIIKRCTELAVEHRYQDGWEVRNELQRFLDGTPVVARPITTSEALLRWTRRRPALAGLIGVLIIVVTASLIGLSMMLARERKLSELAAARQKQAEEIVDTMISRFVVNTSLKHPKLTAEQVELLKQAVAFYEALSTENPKDDTYRHKLSDALHRLADLHATRLQKHDALATRERGLAILRDLVSRHPDNRQYRYDYFFNSFRIATHHASLLQHALAEQHFDIADKEIRHLLTLEPENDVYFDAFASVEGTRLAHCIDRGQIDKAKAMMGGYERLLRELVTRKPDDAGPFVLLSEALRNQSVFAGCRGDWPLAVQLSRESVDASRRAIELRNDWWADQHVLAGCLTQLGIALKQTGEPAAAEQAFLDAVTIMASFRREIDMEQRSAPEFLSAVAQYELAELIFQTGRRDEARELFIQSGQALKQHLGEMPDHPLYVQAWQQWREKCPFEDLKAQWE